LVTQNDCNEADIEEIEKLQRRATKLVKGVKKLGHKDHLMKSHLPTVKLP